MINVCTKNLTLQNRETCEIVWRHSRQSCSRWNKGTFEIKCKHTQWKNNLFLQNIVKLHHLTRTTSSTVQPTKRTLTSTFQECQIWQWNDHMASTFTTWFRRSRTTVSDRHFKVIFNNIDHSIHSAKNQKTWFVKLGTSNCGTTRCWTQSTVQSMSVVLGRRHRVLHVRSLLTRWYDREQELHQVRSESLLYSELLHQEMSTTRSQVRKERKWSKIPTCKSTSKEL